MEEWQRNFICTKLVQLLNYTVCTPILIAYLESSEILSREDAKYLETIGRNEGQFAQSRLLYERVQTRRDGYEKLSYALFQCNQSGALKILLDGFHKEGIDNVLEKCGIKIDFESGFSLDECFEGPNYNLIDKLKIGSQGFMEVIKEAGCEPDFINIFVIREKKLALTYKTIPTLPYAYIERSISNRVKLHPNILKQSCEDIFVFTGITRVELTCLVDPNHTSSSDEQIDDLTSRFILLMDDVDWKEIKHLANIQGNPAHLLRFENLDGGNMGVNRRDDSSILILEETTGNSKVLWSFVQSQPEKQRAYLSEDELVDSLDIVTGSSGIIVCDTAGMGKTYLLGSLARKMSVRHPQDIIAFIELSKFIGTFTGKRIDDELSFDVALMHSLEYISPTALSRTILFHAIRNHSCFLKLFFDGLDEVAAEKLEWTKTFLRSLSSDTRCVHIYVTSRPHLRRDLECTLGVFAYDMLPFTQTNQRQYIQEIWKRSHSESDDSKLETFATECLNNLKSTIVVHERNIMGIPLQCFLLAEVYSENARRYSDPRRSQKLPTFPPTSIYQLYKRYIHKCFEKLKMSEENPGKENLSDVKRYHILKALELLFPTLAPEYARFHKMQVQHPSPIILSLGILEARMTSNTLSVEFVHRSVAEHLVAEYFTDVLHSNSIEEYGDLEIAKSTLTFISSSVLQGRRRFMCNDYRHGHVHFIFYQFTNPAMTYFVNGSLMNDPKKTINPPFASIFLNSITPSLCFEMLCCSIVQNSFGIFCCIGNILRAANESQLKTYKEYFLLKNMLALEPGTMLCPDEWIEPVCLLMCATSRFSSNTMMTQLDSLFRECFKFDLHKFCIQMTKETTTTPLHVAVQEANYELVEYLLRSFTLQNRSLLYHCIAHSYGQSKDMITRRTNICKLLLRKNRSLLNETPTFIPREFHGRSTAERVHPEIIELLVKEGSDISSIFGDTNRSVFYYAAKYMSCIDFEQLFQKLGKEFDRMVKPNYKVDALIHHIFRHQKLSADFMETILRVSKISVSNKEEKYGDNLILSAVRGRCTLAAIKKLIQMGCDQNILNSQGQSILHLAATNGDIEIIKYASSLGIPLTTCDNEGQTPLHKSVKNLNTLEYLLGTEFDFLDPDKNGDTIAHIGALELSADNFHRLVVLLLERDSSGSIFNMKNTKGRTPLEICLRRQTRLDTIDMLLGISNIEIHGVDKKGNNLFFHAVTGNQRINILEKLMDHNIDSNMLNKAGHSAFMQAAHLGNIETVRYLLTAGTENGDSRKCNLNMVVWALQMFDCIHSRDLTAFGLMHGVRFRQNDKILFGLELLQIFFAILGNLEGLESKAKGSIPNDVELNQLSQNETKPDLILKRHHPGRILSKLLGSRKFQSFLCILLEDKHKLDLSCVLNKYGVITEELKTNRDALIDPPDTTSLSGVNLLKALIILGMDIMEKDEENNTLAHYFADCFSAEEYHSVVEFFAMRSLLDAYNIKDSDGKTPLHEAVEKLELFHKTLDLLVGADLQKAVDAIPKLDVHQLPVDLNACDEEGASILFTAVKAKRSLGFIKHLVNLGADWRIRTKHKNNLTQASILCGLVDHLKYFVELGCDVNEQDNDGDNSLLCVVREATENIFEMIEYLLSVGVNKHQVNREGKKAYTYAIEKRYSRQDNFKCTPLT